MPLTREGMKFLFAVKGLGPGVALTIKGAELELSCSMCSATVTCNRRQATEVVLVHRPGCRVRFAATAHLN